MSKRIEKLAILFADICGSTSLYDTLGDETARRLIASCIALMTTQIVNFQGTLIKTIGDEIMCTFPTAEAGLLAACAIQNALQENRIHSHEKLYVRIGFHYGDVICELNDVFGDTVNVAARIASSARGNQIMTSQAVVDALPSHLHKKTHRLMSAGFKGKQEEYDIFIVVWEENDDSCTRINMPQFIDSPELDNELTLSYANKHFVINKNQKSLTIGRSSSCDIITTNNFASRQHARVELQFGRFVIIDVSTNGTYVRLADGSVTHITREEMILHGSGTISLAQPHAENPSEVIEFSIKLG